MAKLIDWIIDLIAGFFGKNKKETIEKKPLPSADHLTINFTLSELTRSATADRHGIDNKPNQQQLANLRRLALALEHVRYICGGSAVIVTSGFRNEEVNRLVGGSPTSSHAQGLAADFTVPGFGDALAVCKQISQSPIEFDQLIFEQGSNSDWVHLGIGPKMRRECLSWKAGKGYFPGLVKL